MPVPITAIFIWLLYPQLRQYLYIPSSCTDRVAKTQMARYVTKIESSLPQAEAFAYMADFANARVWDPSVSEAHRVGDAPIGIGSTFDLVARFGGRDVALRYAIVEYDAPRRIVLEALRPGFVSRDTFTVEPRKWIGRRLRRDSCVHRNRSVIRRDDATDLQSGRSSGDDRDASGAELVTRSPAVNLVT